MEKSKMHILRQSPSNSTFLALLGHSVPDFPEGVELGRGVPSSLSLNITLIF